MLTESERNFASSNASPRATKPDMYSEMKTIFSLVLLATAAFADVVKITPTEAATLVSEGKALLIDVREPAEWAETGVAAPARLLSKSDFDGAQKDWKPFLADAKGKRIIVYCKSGGRAVAVARALTKQGYTVSNAGGFDGWKGAGLPVRSEKKP